MFGAGSGGVASEPTPYSASSFQLSQVMEWQCRSPKAWWWH